MYKGDVTITIETAWKEMLSIASKARPGSWPCIARHSHRAALREGSGLSQLVGCLLLFLNIFWFVSSWCSSPLDCWTPGRVVGITRQCANMWGWFVCLRGALQIARAREKVGPRLEGEMVINSHCTLCQAIILT